MSLIRFLSELREESPTLGPEVNEPRENTWKLGLSSDEVIDAEALEVELREVARLWLKSIRGRYPGQSATVYVWLDEQASQLRISASSCTPERLPFGCVVDLDSSPAAIIRRLVDGPGIIPWSDSHMIGVDSPETSDKEFRLAVWAVTNETS